MEERKFFLDKFTEELIKSNKKAMSQESAEKTKGYLPAIDVPDLHDLHEMALLEARREKSDQFEIEAIENEMYMKEYLKSHDPDQDLNQAIEMPSMQEITEQPYPIKQQLFDEEAVENETYNNQHLEETTPEEESIPTYPQYQPKLNFNEEKPIASNNQFKPKFNEEKQFTPTSKELDFDEEAVENEQYGKEHIPELEIEEVTLTNAYQPRQEDIDNEAVENEQYGKEHPAHEEDLYTSQITPLGEKLSAYDTPKLYDGKKLYPQQASPPVEQRMRAWQFPSHQQKAVPLTMNLDSKRGGFIRPLSKEEIPDTITGLANLKELITDHAVTYINCPGPLKPLSIKRMGIPETIRIMLDEQKIQQVIQEFSDASRIPYIDGIFKAIVEDLMITAVINEAVGSRFTITRMMR